MTTTTKHITAGVRLALLLVLLLFCIVPATAHALAPRAIVSVTAATAPSGAGSGYNVTFDNGLILFVEPRVFETHGRAPSRGVVHAFSDQSRVMGWWMGYATFTQGLGATNVTYHGYRR